MTRGPVAARLSAPALATTLLLFGMFWMSIMLMQDFDLAGRLKAVMLLGLAVATEATAGQLFLGNPEVRTSYMVFDSQPEGKDADLQFLLDNVVLIFARKSNPTRRDPSFMKTFRLMNKWMVPGSYVRDDGRVEVAKFDWSEDVQVTNAAVAVRLNISA